MNDLHLKRKRKEFYRLMTIYAVMALAVVTIVVFIVMFLLGYRFDTGKGHIEQYAFMQFSSKPSGANITINGKAVDAKTPTKNSVSAGKYDIVMWRDGYETWQKTVDLKAGTLAWLNYALLVPKNLSVEPVANYATMYVSLVSPDSRNMLVAEHSDVPTFDMVNLTSDLISSNKLVIPTNIYSDPFTVGVTHIFQPESWDDGGRYILVKHNYGDKFEWLVMDTQNISATKNITRLLNITASQISFAGTSGNILYALDSLGDIHKLDLSASTVSRPLVSSATKFSVYKSNIITYVGNNISNQFVGVYRDGDDKSYNLRSVPITQSPQLQIATAEYFNENYVAITDGKKVDILSGSYPNTANGDTASLKLVATFTVDNNIGELSFSPTGEYVFVQSGASFASYDLEYQILKSSTISGDGAVSTLKWLDDNYIWSDRDGNLTIREFDGFNIHKINTVSIGQSVTLTHNGRFIYSVNQNETGYQLQRVRMILP